MRARGSTPDRVTMRQMLMVAAPAALAIAVFGIIYGSLARPDLGFGGTLLSSLLIFSGSVQFTVAGLLNAGAEAGALIVAALTLNLRNLLLGALLRPRVDGGPLRRAAFAWFLTDETAGLALTRDGDAGRALLVTGATFYLSWQVGTILGLLGASFEGVADLALATFPVLFIGLAALASLTRAIALRAVAAAALTIAVVALAPDLGAVAAIGATLVVSLPGRSA
jgi:predicted branched-subunit amino acid permease